MMRYDDALAICWYKGWPATGPLICALMDYANERGRDPYPWRNLWTGEVCDEDSIGLHPMFARWV